MHIHVVDGRKECKFWLREGFLVVLADNYGFSKTELIKIRKIFELIKNKWDEHCKDTSSKKYK